MSLTIALEVQTGNHNCPVCRQERQCLQNARERIPWGEGPAHRRQMDYIRSLPSAPQRFKWLLTGMDSGLGFAYLVKQINVNTAKGLK